MPGESLNLSGDEAHHMLNVIRVQVGEEVALLDGGGDIVIAKLTAARKREATLQAISRETVNSEPSRELTIAVAPPRSARMEFLVEKCAEAGVRRIVPIMCARGVVDPTERPESHLRRWKRTVIETAKQCGGTRLMEISAPAKFADIPFGAGSDVAKAIASLGPDTIPLGVFRSRLKPGQPVMALVGPEGDFTDEELARAKEAGFTAVSLGPRVLRVETAALALACCLLIE